MDSEQTVKADASGLRRPRQGKCSAPGVREGPWRAASGRICFLSMESYSSALFLVSHVAFPMTTAFGRHHSEFISESAASAFLFSDLTFMRTVGRTPQAGTFEAAGAGRTRSSRMSSSPKQAGQPPPSVSGRNLSLPCPTCA